MKKKNTSVEIAFAVLLFFASGWMFSSHDQWASNNLFGWMINMGIIVFIMSRISKGFNLKWNGFLIDKTRKRFSLSRLQLVLWTVIILSAYVSINFTAFWSYLFEANCCDEVPKLQEIPESVLQLLGISAGTAAAAPAINQVKSSLTNRAEARQKEVNCEEAATYEKVLNNTLENANSTATNIGSVYVNTDIDDAQLLDIFRGEEVKDHDLVDISKVQNFIFTIVAVGAYGFQLVLELVSNNPSLPVVSTPLMTIIGISHAYYAVSKAIPQSVPARQSLESAEFVDGTI